MENSKEKPIDLSKMPVNGFLVNQVTEDLSLLEFHKKELSNKLEVYEVYRDIVDQYDYLLELTLEKLEEEIACDVGCSFCCHFDVGVSEFEMHVIAAYISDHFSSKQKYELAKRNKQVLDTISKSTDLRVNLRLPCSFLVDNKCSIYEARPFACRGYASPDDLECKSAFESEVPSEAVIPIVQEFFDTYRAISQVIHGLCSFYHQKHLLQTLDESVTKILKIAKSYQQKK